MSSPPRALSPPYSGVLNLPKKRPASSTSNLSSKRRKPSTSSSSHPLRQTSFPPPESYSPAASSRAPSFSPPVSDTYKRGANSVAGASSVAPSKSGKRGRKKQTDGQSATGTSAAGGARAVSFRADDDAGSVSTRRNERQKDSAERAEEEKEVEEGLADTVMEEGEGNEAARKLEAEHRNMLVNAFSADQTQRFDVWRRVKLNPGKVKRIANHTLSQSISESCHTVINGYTKAFLGELIGRAREVQLEWLAASPTLPTGEQKIVAQANGTTDAESNATIPNTEDKTASTLSHGLPRSYFVVEERDRGPLTPDHLREAWRRYRKDRDGGAAGSLGMSLTGKENVAARAGGKRLFR